VLERGRRARRSWRERPSRNTGDFGLDAAFPTVLLALVLPSLADRGTRHAALAGAVIAVAATPFLPAGLPVLLALAGLVLAAGPPPPGRTRSRAGGALMPLLAIAALAAGTYAVPAWPGRCSGNRMRIPDRLQRLLSVATAVLLTAWWPPPPSPRGPVSRLGQASRRPGRRGAGGPARAVPGRGHGGRRNHRRAPVFRHSVTGASGPGTQLGTWAAEHGDRAGPTVTRSPAWRGGAAAGAAGS
jgi:hypothetical protein